MADIAERLRQAQGWFDSDDQITFVVRDAATEIDALQARAKQAEAALAFAYHQSGADERSITRLINGTEALRKELAEVKAERDRLREAVSDFFRAFDRGHITVDLPHETEQHHLVNLRTALEAANG